MEDSDGSEIDFGRYVRIQKKRKRSKSESGSGSCFTTKAEEEIDNKVTEKVLKIMESFSQVSGNPNMQKFISKSELIPNFDPEKSEYTVTNWIHKIDQLGNINHWDDETKSFCLQSHLIGIAKTWYNTLTDYNLSWEEWKTALIHAFPSHEEFSSLLKQMLNRRKLRSETMMQYFYNKNMLVKKCNITGRNAVSCIIDGLPIEIQPNAKAGNYATPDELYYGLLSKIENSVDSCLKFHYTKKDGSGSQSQVLPTATQTSASASGVRCFHCNKIGHTVRHCYSRLQIPSRTVEASGPSALGYQPRTSLATSKLSQCELCGKRGHTKDVCWSNPPVTSPATSRVPQCEHCGKRGHSKDLCWTNPNVKKVQVLNKQV